MKCYKLTYHTISRYMDGLGWPWRLLHGGSLTAYGDVINIEYGAVLYTNLLIGSMAVGLEALNSTFYMWLSILRLIHSSTHCTKRSCPCSIA